MKVEDGSSTKSDKCVGLIGPGHDLQNLEYVKDTSILGVSVKVDVAGLPSCSAEITKCCIPTTKKKK